MSEHAWVHENLDAFLVDGLPAEERERLQRHIADCAACAAELSAAQKLDGVLDALFVGARPDAALEDRAIRHLRQAKPPRRSALKKAAWFVGGVAAVLVLGVLGGFLQALAEDGGLPFPGMKRKTGEARTESRNYLTALLGSAVHNFHGAKLEANGQALPIDRNQAYEKTPSQAREGKKDLPSIVVTLDPERLRAYNISPDKVAESLNKGNIITPSGNARIKDQVPIVSANSIVVDPKDLGNIPIIPEKGVYLRDVGSVHILPPTGLSIMGQGGAIANQDGATRGFTDFDGSITTTPGNFVGSRQQAFIPNFNNNWAGNDADFGRPGGQGGPLGGHYFNSNGTAERLGESKDGKPLQQGLGGEGYFGPRNQFFGTEMAGGGSAPGKSTGGPPLTTGEIGGYPGAYGHNSILSSVRPLAVPPGTLLAPPGVDKREMGEAKAPINSGSNAGGFQRPMEQPPGGSPSTNLGYFKPADSLTRDFDTAEAEERFKRAQKLYEKGAIGKEDFNAALKERERLLDTEVPGASKKDGDTVNRDVGIIPTKPLKPGEKPPAVLGRDVNVTDQALPDIPLPAITQQPSKAPEPVADTSRKIIRTGEMEFEIESFDKAIVSVGSLIGGVKGGFIATINSDKLPNGKMRGSIVVRMPPQFLDKFLSDLRRELEKGGEMKNQRLGSLDVTKQYTDLESRLRAARTMEERLLNIIKTGKGEIKDLILAERELGVWRTKIEEMEGEIRYYGNQISLSTITITLTEKEIQAASALVITERVGMRIEVEDVDKAHLDALKAVADEKGRITKSELKQHPAGQLEAIIQVEVAPDKAKKLREVFKKLGNVTFNDIQRVQQAEGGSGKFLDIKTQQRDVQIHVVLYDTANIQPRESVNMLIAADDVQASYRALQAAVQKAKGQIRVGQLKEPDKVNISADFSFDVPTPEKEGIDKVLAKLGVTLSKSDSQVPVNETATDRKFGYRLVLRSLATVPARDTSIQQIAVNEVPKVFHELQDAVLAVKGVIHVQQLNETNKINISAVLSFDVAQSDRGAFDAVLAKLGLLLSSTSAKAGANEITTDRKFGYRLDLLSLASIQPRDTITQQIAANDVPASFRELQDAVTKVKGIIRVRQLNEQDRLNISADLSFDVPKEDRQTIDALIAKIGAVLTSANGQAPLDQVATDRKIGYRLKLLNLANIQPRDVNLLTLASNDVPASFAELQDAVLQAKGVIHVGQLIENNKINVEARLDFDIAAADKPAIDKVIAKVGAVLKRSNSQAKVNELASDRKVGYRMFFANVAAIPPRERTTLTIKVDDVDAKVAELTKLVRASKGQASKAEVTLNKHGEKNAILVLNMPLSAQDAILAECLRARAVLYQDQKQDPQVSDNELATAQIAVTITGGKPIVSNDESLGAYVSESLSISFRVFAWSVMLVILGLSVVLPWALLAWVAYRVVRRMRGKPETAAVG